MNLVHNSATNSRRNRGFLQSVTSWLGPAIEDMLIHGYHVSVCRFYEERPRNLFIAGFVGYSPVNVAQGEITSTKKPFHLHRFGLDLVVPAERGEIGISEDEHPF